MSKLGVGFGGDSVELSLCAASRMWVRHRSLVIVPPEGGLEFSAGLTKKFVFYIHVTVKISLGFTLQDCKRVGEHKRFLLLTRSTSVESCSLRIEREARKIAECTSYTTCILLSFSSDCAASKKRPRSRGDSQQTKKLTSLTRWT